MRPSFSTGVGRVWRALRLRIDRGSARPRRSRRRPGLGLSCLPALAALFISSTALAQAQASTERSLREVERGFWVGSRVGAVVYFDLPGEGAATSYGSLMGIEAGVDLGPSIQLGLVAWGQSVGAPAEYLGITDDALDPKRARGDFQTMMAGGMLRLAFLRLQDDNGIDRTFFFARVAGGATLNRPVGILDEQGYFATAGLGVEYFTRLRHFSVGVELDAVGLIGDAGTALGVAALPHLKYTF